MAYMHSFSRLKIGVFLSLGVMSIEYFPFILQAHFGQPIYSRAFSYDYIFYSLIVDFLLLLLTSVIFQYRFRNYYINFRFIDLVVVASCLNVIAYFIDIGNLRYMHRGIGFGLLAYIFLNAVNLGMIICIAKSIKTIKRNETFLILIYACSVLSVNNGVTQYILVTMILLILLGKINLRPGYSLVSFLLSLFGVTLVVLHTKEAGFVWLIDRYSIPLNAAMLYFDNLDSLYDNIVNYMNIFSCRLEILLSGSRCTNISFDLINYRYLYGEGNGGASLGVYSGFLAMFPVSLIVLPVFIFLQISVLDAICESPNILNYIALTYFMYHVTNGIYDLILLFSFQWIFILTIFLFSIVRFRSNGHVKG